MLIKRFLIFIILIIFLSLSCNKPGPPILESEEDSSIQELSIPDESENTEISPESSPSGNLILQEDFTYLGFFKLPEPSGGSNWEYSGHGLTYYPEGDPDGTADGFPGSLFGFGHDHQLFVSEISIPEPVISANDQEVNTADTLQPFADLSGGIFSAPEMTIPRAGLVYLGEPEPRLYFTFGEHFQDFEPSHGWANLDLTEEIAQGPWKFGDYTNYVTNDYLFEIPPAWAEMIAPGPLIASGRAREGLWSGRGPALFAYNSGDVDNPLPPNNKISGVIPLLLYGEQLPGQPDLISSPSQEVIDYREADHWWGGE